MAISNILKLADIFYELTTTQIELVASVAEERKFQRGEIIFREQTAGRELYVIADGEVDIEIDPALVGNQPNGAPYRVATLRRGQSFGEVALVDEGIRTASARATQHETRLILIPREKLMLLCETYPPLGYRLMRNLAADLALKIRHTDLQIREHLYWSRAAQTEGKP